MLWDFSGMCSGVFLGFVLDGSWICLVVVWGAFWDLFWDVLWLSLICRWCFWDLVGVFLGCVFFLLCFFGVLMLVLGFALELSEISSGILLDFLDLFLGFVLACVCICHCFLLDLAWGCLAYGLGFGMSSGNVFL